MTPIYRLALADTFTGQYPDARAFVEGLLGQVLAEARATGWTAARLFHADMTGGEPDGMGATLAIALEPAEADASVDDVRAFLKDRRRVPEAADFGQRPQARPGAGRSRPPCRSACGA